MTKIMLAACLAIIPCAYAIQYQTHKIDIVALAEDDCEYFYGAYALSDVIPVDGPIHSVICRYR